MRKGTFSSMYGGALQGGMGGANVGGQFGGPKGAMVGGGIGAIAGALGGYFAGEADAPMDEAQLEQMLMSNKISRLQYNQMLEEIRAKKRQERTQSKVGRLVAEKLRSRGGVFSNTLGGV
jgi:hypothetical protein